jgi:cyclophilin family peptidyl-prolyl cis-trans isomerase
MFQND